MSARFLSEFDTAKAIRTVLGIAVTAILLAVFPFTPQPAMDIKLLLLHWTALALAALLVLHSFQKSPRGYGIMLPLLTVFVLLNAIAALLSSYPQNTLAEVGRLFSFLTLFVAASRAYSTADQLHRLLKTICAATAVASAYGLLQRFGLDPLPWAQSLTVTVPATFGNTNLAGHVLALAIILCVYLALAQRSKLAIAILPLLVYHQYLTHHRAGTMAMAAAATFAVALYGSQYLHSKKKAALAGLGAVGIAIILVMACGRFPLDASLLLRYNSYYSASRMAAAAPVLGFGPGNYVIENVPFWTEQQQEQFARGHTYDDHPHCEPLYAACSAGLPAGALFLAFFIAGIVAASLFYSRSTIPATRRLSLMFAAVFCAALVDSLFGFNFRAPASGALIVVLAGCFDGMYSPRRQMKLRPIGAIALFLAVLYLNGPALKTFGAATLQYAAKVDMKFGSYDSAAKNLARAEALAPADWRIPQLRAAALAKTKYDDVKACLGRSLKLNPYYANACIDMAELELRTAFTDHVQPSQVQSAGQYAKSALTICPTLPEAWDVLARAAFSSRRFKDARDAACKAIQYGSTRKSSLHTLIGETYAEENDFAGAEAWFKKAARQVPPDPLLWGAFQQLSQKQNNDTALIAALERAIAVMGKTPDKYKNDFIRASQALGAVYLNKNKPEAALPLLQKSATLTPDFPVWRLYFRACEATQKTNQFFNDLKQLNPECLNQPDPALHIAYARLLKTTNPQQARAYLTQALSKISFNEQSQNVIRKELQQR